MKKIFLSYLALTILAGCSGGSGKSYLDEKIKCKELAEEKFSELKKTYFVVQDTKTVWYEKDNSCITIYSLGSIWQMENLLNTEILGYWSNDSIESDKENFEELFQKYFGENFREWVTKKYPLILDQ